MSQCMIVIQVERTARASASRIFQLLYDGPSWPRWSKFTKFRLEKKGISERLGIGAIRVMSTRISRVREQIIDAEPDTRFSYTLLSGLPLKDYRADVELTAFGENTRIVWRARFRPQFWGTGWFWRMIIQFVIRDTMTGLVSAAQDWPH